MQFIANGPDVPNSLIHAHEKGKVVFFCGAGISYPAGLPGFKELVDNLYEKCEKTPDTLESTAKEKNQYDVALNLLERRVPSLRSALPGILNPSRTNGNLFDTHRALLVLAQDEDERVKLVTTNFDRLFENALTSNSSLPSFSAPLLPSPKKQEWSGVVYLHGVLPCETSETTSLKHLVLTSADFGRAYLTERWAARFVSELFRNYTVCFIGYSIDDLVLRYMMDALAADRQEGEDSSLGAYAFASYAFQNKDEVKTEWEAKGVIPILYNGADNHATLHNTIKTWAEIWHDKTHGKEQIISMYAMAKPTKSTQQDDFVGRVIWALSDETGLPAKFFSELNPAPSLEWLNEFKTPRYNCKDLSLFGVFSNHALDEKLTFSLLCRPTPYNLAPAMQLAYHSFEHQLDKRMWCLANWLIRHLNDPKLIIWLAEQGGQMNSSLVFLIERKLDELNRLEKEKNKAQLQSIRKNEPNAIPTPMMRVFWELFINGHIKSNTQYWSFKFSDFENRAYQSSILPIGIRQEIRTLLTPKIILSESIPSKIKSYKNKLKSPESHISWELTLQIHHIRSLRPTESFWKKHFSDLFNDLQQLLLDALKLIRDLKENVEYADTSDWSLPSIAPHWQNKNSESWTLLIELVRDAWCSILNQSPQKAMHIARLWFEQPFLSFKRLAFFAASQNTFISAEEWGEWILSDHSHWLWSYQSKREVLRLFVLQGINLKPKIKRRLISSILTGPPPDYYKSKSHPEGNKIRFEHSIWLRLSKLKQSGTTLGVKAEKKLLTLSIKNPSWNLSDNESEEFSHWSWCTGDPGYESTKTTHPIPSNLKELIAWLKSPPKSNDNLWCRETDDWSERCQTRFFLCLSALHNLSKESIWPEEQWRSALQVWGEEKMSIRSWKFVAPLIQKMPDENFKNHVQEISHWVEKISENVQDHTPVFFELCNRILQMNYPKGKHINSSVSHAINHPVGIITSALLNRCFKDTSNDCDLLPEKIKTCFSAICNPNKKQLFSGRVILASRVIPLFRIDPEWTKTYLLPFFNWKHNSDEAKGTWEGFFWSPRLYPPLQNSLKSYFFETINYYEKMEEHFKTQFIRFLTYLSLEFTDTYTYEDYQKVYQKIPSDALVTSLQTVVQMLRGAGEKKELYWEKYILPFFKKIWPNTEHLEPTLLSESFSEICIATGNKFPESIHILKNRLTATRGEGMIILKLFKSGLCKQFPKDCLFLIDRIIPAEFTFFSRDLRKCLSDIIEADNTLKTKKQYRRLDNLLRLHNA